MTTDELGNDAMLPQGYDPSAQLAADEAASAEEDARVQATSAEEDPGQDYNVPAPEEDPETGFDPLPPDTP